MLAGGERLEAGVDMVRVGGSDDNGLDVPVGEHRVVVEERLGRMVGHSHLLDEISRHVANCVELSVFRLRAGPEMGELSDRAAAEHPDTEKPILLLDHGSPSTTPSAP